MKAILTTLLCVLASVAVAQTQPVEIPVDLEQVNMPLFQTKYTADPSPLVVGDTLFLYTSHDASPEDIPDENEEGSAGFFMYDWLLWSTTDMVNWTEHGAVASLKDFPWRSRENGAWAIQTVERNGKYYLYAPLHGHGIGVLVADSPYGPFKDPLGKPLVWDQSNWYDIDPTVYTDDDGQAYMYWGNPYTYYARLNDDMISLKDSVVRLDYHIEHYQEGPWFYKRNGHYYLGYATTCCPEALGYAMSDSPTGPWESKGYIMRPTDRDRGNHPGICDYKGHSYIFGQDYDLMHLETYVHHERRSVSATEIIYNADGTIREVPYWLDQKPLAQLHWLNPYQRVEAETMAWGYGLKSAKMGIENTGVVKDMPVSTGKKNMYVFDLNDGEYIRLRGVDFAQGASLFSITAAATGSATVTLRLDSRDGEVIGMVEITSTGSVETYQPFTTEVRTVAGVHDLYLCFDKTQGDVRLDWWQFARGEGESSAVPLVYGVENTGAGLARPVMPAASELPLQTALPDPLEGVKDFSDWERRRNDISAQIQHYGIGEKPAVRKEQVKARMDGDTLIVDVTVDGETLTLRSELQYPATGQPPYALMIGTSGIALPKPLFEDRPIATAVFHEDQVNDYSQWRPHHERGEHPFDRLYPQLTDNGAYSEWAWGLSRLIDGLQQLGPEQTKIDVRHIGVTGCSYAGKMALYCGAFDERVALTIAQEPGGGGAAAWRISHPQDSVENLDKTDYHWFLESQKTNFGGDNVYRLPYDQHELCAMICPRALLLLGNPDYKWLADEAMLVSAQAAHQVWERFGISDRMDWSIVGGHPHCMLPESQWPIVQSFIDRFLLERFR